MTAKASSSIPEGSLSAAKPSARSRLDLAMRDVAKWPPQDKEFFIAVFTTRKTSSQLAREMGLSPSGYQARHRDIIRRFMRAAVPRTSVI